MNSVHLASLKPIKISDVNSLSVSDFENLFKNVVELWPRAAEAVVLQQPFADLHELIVAFIGYLDNLSVDDKVAVLRAHPDLAGKLLHESKLSKESAIEQALAGLNQLTEQEELDIVDLNKKYSEKFGFPFVICVRRHNKIQSILEGFRARLPNSRDEEINNGIEQVKKICQLRIEDIVEL